MQEFPSGRKITLTFNAEAVTWWGGFREQLVRSVKTSPRKPFGKTSATKTELSIILNEVGCVLNFRSLTYTDLEPSETHPLTPSHCLFGKGNAYLPDIPRNEISHRITDLTRRWCHHKSFLNHFGSRSDTQYILQLKSMPQHSHRSSSYIKVQDLVLLKAKYPRAS